MHGTLTEEVACKHTPRKAFESAYTNCVTIEEIATS